MPAYADLAKRQNDLIRKALEGSVFVGPPTAPAVATITQDSVATPGTPELAALPAGYSDLGYLDDNGAVFSDAVSNSDITSWGSVEPTRRDITSDVSTLHVVAQETNLQTMAAYIGVDPAAITHDATTGEVGVSKPDRPSVRHYRIYVLGVDIGDAGEIYVAQFWPRASVTDKGDQVYASGDTGIWWDTTWTAYKDATLGYAVRFMFGGPGWKPLLTEMGFGA